MFNSLPRPTLLRFTRSGTRRSGDEYQDVQAISKIIEWLKNVDRYQWMRLEADKSGYLDDIHAMHTDGTLEVAQVKFSTTAQKHDDTWTWENLLEQGASGTKDSLLQKWFGTWQTFRASGPPIRSCVISNRQAHDDLRLDGFGRGKVKWDQLAAETKKEIIEQLGSETEAREFFNSFEFRLNEASLRELEHGAITWFERLGGTPAGWISLEKQVREWTNSKNNPSPDGRIFLDNIYDAAKLSPVRLQRLLAPLTFFERYMDRNRLFHHCLPQVGQRTQLGQLLNFAGSDRQIALVSGRGGSGKSKLIHTFCRHLGRKYIDLRVRLTAENVPITDETVRESQNDSDIVIVDDAHRIEGIELILALAVQNKRIKVVLVTRPHAVSYLTMQIINTGFDRSDIVSISPLAELNYAHHHRKLARLALGQQWANYADELASATRDSPLLTVLGGQLLQSEQVSPSALTQNKIFRQEILSRFRDIIFGTVIENLDGKFTPQLCANLLPYIAALGPFNTEYEPMVNTVARLLGTDAVKLRQLIGALIESGALVRGQRLVRIVPDVLSDFILEDACFTPDGTSTGWADQLYDAVAHFDLDVVLRNLSEVDWRVRSSETFADDDGGHLLGRIWLDIHRRFRASTLKERKNWLERMMRIAFIQPDPMWPLIEIAINEPAPEKQDEISPALLPYIKTTTHADVVAAAVPIVRAVARHDRFTARCADLLWRAGRDLETEPGRVPAAIQALRELSSYEHDKSLIFNNIVLDRCRVWMSDPDILNYSQSIVRVIAPLLARQYNWSTSSDKRWQVSEGASFQEGYQALRLKALELVERCALSGITEVVLEALDTLKEPVSEQGLWELQKDNPELWQEFEKEQLTVIQIAERVAETNEDPFVRLKLWELLHWQASNGLRNTVKSRARHVLEATPHSSDSRFILLVTDRYSQEEFDGNWQALESEENSTKTRPFPDRRGFARNIEFAREVVLEWVQTHRDPQEGFDAFDNWLKRIEGSRWWDETWTRSNPFLLQLASDYPEYARKWCESAPEKPESRATGKCDDLLCELRKQDQRDALMLAQGFLSKDHPNLWLRVASSYSWRCWPIKPLPEEWEIVERLLTFPNLQVKRTAARIVENIASVDFPRAVGFVLNTDIGEDPQLADTLFGIFEERRGLDFASISTDELELLLKKLVEVESVADYNVGRFLLQAALRDPISVAKLLLERIKRKSAISQNTFSSATIDRISLRNALDRFSGLPQSAFHDDKFKEIANHPAFKDALRLIRDASLDKAYSAVGLYEDTVPELFRDFSINYSQPGLEVLEEWIDSGDCSKVSAAVILLEYTSLGFYIKHLKFLSNYLRRASECGSSVFDRVESAMLGCAEYGPPRAMASLRGERSNALFHKATETLEKIQSDPLSLDFFQTLRKKGKEMIEAEMAQAADEEVLFSVL
jgi:hypothetical protein